MKNTRLQRLSDSVKSELDYVIYNLIDEINQLEDDKDEMQDKIDLLKQEIEELKNAQNETI